MHLQLESNFRGIDADRFVELLLSRELAERLVEQSKGARELLVRETREDGRVFLKTRISLIASLPGPFKKLLPGGRMVYFESMTVDPASRTGQFEARGEEGDSRVRVHGEFAITQAAAGVHRRVEFEITSTIFGLGGAIEKLIAKALSDDHEKGDRALQTFIDEWMRARS